MENETYLSQVLQMSSLMDNYIESHIYHHAMGNDAVTDTEEIISGTLQSAEKPTSLGRVIEALEDSTNPVPETVTTENNENIPANTATVQEESLTSGNYTDHQSSNFDKSSATARTPSFLQVTKRNKLDAAFGEVTPQRLSTLAYYEVSGHGKGLVDACSGHRLIKRSILYILSDYT